MRSGERSVLSGTYYITSTRASKTRSVPGVGWELLRIILFLYTGIFPYMCGQFQHTHRLFFTELATTLEPRRTSHKRARRSAHCARSSVPALYRLLPKE